MPKAEGSVLSTAQLARITANKAAAVARKRAKEDARWTPLEVPSVAPVAGVQA